MDHLVPESAEAAGHDQSSLPPELDSSDPTSFAWNVIHRRHPLLIDQAKAAYPYGPPQIAALDALAAETSDGVVTPLEPGAHGGAAWTRWGNGKIGVPWDQTPFLWAESYFYRRLLAAVDFFSPGPWFWLDLFAHQKDAELRDPALETDLGELDQLADLDAHDRRNALLLSSLWGNRADLGFAAQAGQAAASAGRQVVVDDSDRLWSTLDSNGGSLSFIADNAGRELLADLMLIDELLSGRSVSQVLLHVKPTPYYVSDATSADVAACLQRLAAAGGYAAHAAQRLQEAFAQGRLRLRTSGFYVAPLDFRSMPADLTTEFNAATLTLLKGDLNYRRVVGDRRWAPTTDTADAASYFPGPLALLRTLKSDVVVGIPAHDLATLESDEPEWRVSGTHALIQVVA